MKEILKREEFAKEVNFGKHPVLTIDMSKEGFMNAIYTGCKVRIDNGNFRTGERFLARGEFIYNKQEDKFEVANYGICISARFCYEDAMKDIEYAQAPIVKDGEEVIIVKHNSETKDIRVFIATAKLYDIHCSTMMTFE